jgi:hypothetical protein
MKALWLLCCGGEHSVVRNRELELKGSPQWPPSGLEHTQHRRAAPASSIVAIGYNKNFTLRWNSYTLYSLFVYDEKVAMWMPDCFFLNVPEQILEQV